MTKIVLFVKKNKFAFISVIIALSFIVCCFSVNTFIVESASEKSRSEYINDVYDGDPIELSQDTVVRQTFSASKSFSTIGTLFYNTENAQGMIILDLYNAQTNEMLASSSINISDLVHAQYSMFSFEQKLDLENTKLALEISAITTSESSIFVACSVENMLDGTSLIVNDEAKQGTIPIKVSYEAIGSFPSEMFIAISVLLAIFISLLFFFSRLRNFPVHKLFLVAVIVLGILYNFLLPPYAAPDEMFHINQAFNNSSVFLGEVERGEIEWNENYKRPSDQNSLIQEKMTTIFTYQEMFNNIFSSSPDNASDSVKYNQEQVGGFNLLYLFSSIGLIISRILGLGFVPALILGRLFNFAFFVFMSYFAVKLTPVAKSCFAVVSLLPMTLHLAISFSRDSVLFSLAIIFTAYCLKCAYDPTVKTISIKSTAIICVLIAAISPSKIVYLPLCFLVFIIPSSRFSSKKSALYTKLIFAACILLPYCFSSSGAVAAGVIASSTQGVVASAPDVHPDMIRFSIPYILSHLKETIYLTTNTFTQNTSFYFTSMLGSHLGYYNLAIDPIWIVGLSAVLLLAALDSSTSLLLKPKTKFTGISIVLVISALIVAGCITWTPTYYTAIYGIQGRYLLPVLPLFLVCLQSKRLQIIGDKSKAIIWGISALQCFIIINIFLVVLAR